MRTLSFSCSLNVDNSNDATCIFYAANLPVTYGCITIRYHAYVTHTGICFHSIVVMLTFMSQLRATKKLEKVW